MSDSKKTTNTRFAINWESLLNNLIKSQKSISFFGLINLNLVIKNKISLPPVYLKKIISAYFF